MEYNIEENKKWISDQDSVTNYTRNHNIQYDNWRLFTNSPTNPEVKINTAIWERVSTNILETIDNSTFKTLLLS